MQAYICKATFFSFLLNASPIFTFLGVCSCSLYSVHDEEKPFELEIAWICDASDREFRRVPADILEAAEQQAKASLEESDMCAPTFNHFHKPALICCCHSSIFAASVSHWHVQLKKGCLANCCRMESDNSFLLQGGLIHTTADSNSQHAAGSKRCPNLSLVL